MDWLNLHTSTLDSVEFIGSKPAQRSTWLCLSRYCVGQENGGTIADCGDWNDRRWQQLCRVTKREVSEACDLWQWVDGSLVVWAYPIEKENEVRAKREYGKLGGRPATNQMVNHEVNQTKTTRHDSHETEGNRKGRERKGKRKDKPAPKAPPAPAGALSRPSSVAEAQAYFASQDPDPAAIEEAAAFFDHYEGNGWKQGGRAVIRSWHSVANNWIRRWRKGGVVGEKNPAMGRAARGAAPVAPFDPEQPHAHTGGLADVAAGGES